jgi:AraC-like DNA-binding protein
MRCQRLPPRKKASWSNSPNTNVWTLNRSRLARICERALMKRSNLANAQAQVRMAHARYRATGGGRLLSVAEVAKLLHYSRQTAARMFKMPGVVTLRKGNPVALSALSLRRPLWETHGVKTLENRIPKQNDTVTVEGRTDRFLVIGIDSINKTVEVRTTSASFSASFVVVKGVPWTAVSYLS